MPNELIYPFGVLRLFFSLRCNFKCGYCSMTSWQPDLWKGEEYTPEEVDADVWIKALARIKPTNQDFTVSPCNAEPGIFKGAGRIINSIPHFNTFFYTNGSTESMEEIKQMTPRDNLSFYVSYHRGQISPEEFLKNALWMEKTFRRPRNVINFHAPAFPPFAEHLKEDKIMMAEKGVNLDVEHEFLGLYKGQMGWSYLKGGKWIEDRFANRLQGTPKKTVLCKVSQNHASYYSRGYTVAPNGNMYVCWRYLYNHSDKGIVGNFFDPEFQFKDEFFECSEYGDCNLCAWHNMIIDKETGKVLDDDVYDRCEKNSISACLIVKNEEAMLPDCLDSIKDICEEIIVVDTGSTDKTVEIAESRGAKVFHREWDEDFSAARNFAMSKATQEWIFTIDADERIDVNDARAMKLMLTNVKQDVIVVNLMNLYGNPRKVRGIGPQVRFFRRSYGPSYLGRVHNRPVIKEGTGVMRVPFRIFHFGYDLGPEKMAEKYQRTVDMCRRMVSDEPNNPEGYFHLARALKIKDGKFNMEAAGEIVTMLEKALELSGYKNDPQNVYIQCLALLSFIKCACQNFKDAVKYGEMALVVKPDYLDALFHVGIAYTYGVNALKGEGHLLKYLEIQGKYDFDNAFDAIIMEHANDRIPVYNALIEIEKWKANMSVAQGVKNG